MVQVESPTSLVIDSSQGRQLFVFDRVFGEDVSQDGVWSYLHDSVDAFVQGYNVSVLAYGQSGSGKSYTMGTSGPAEQNDSHIMGKPACSYPAARSAFIPQERGDAEHDPQVSFQGRQQPCLTN